MKEQPQYGTGGVSNTETNNSDVITPPRSRAKRHTRHKNTKPYIWFRHKKVYPIDHIYVEGCHYAVIETYRTHCRLAIDRKHNRKVVLRFFERSRKKLAQREIDILVAAARHCNSVPRVLLRHRYNGMDCLVIEWTPGDALRTILNKTQATEPSYYAPLKSAKMLLSLAEGLQKLHRNNLFHLDLKPDNLIVTHGPTLKMIDFGIARSPDHRRSEPGTPGYASPEQWYQDKHIDHRADQFSASVVLYQMLTKQIPYDNLGGKAQPAQQKRPIVSTRRYNRHVWKALDEVVCRGAALDKAQRYPSTEAWVSALKASIKHHHTTHNASLIKEAWTLISEDLAQVWHKIRGK